MLLFSSSSPLPSLPLSFTTMDSPDFSPGHSPRRELQLQGPRPTPLKVSNDSHKIRKPPLAPPQQQPHPRRPVIIYTVSPKVIHTNPSEFMALVQRLTGSTATFSSSSSSSSSSCFQDDNSGAISPAARYASIEKTKSQERKKPQISHDMVEGIEMSSEVERTVSFPGILSPNPASLPTIPPNFFSPASDQNLLSFFHGLSPAGVIQGNRNYIENNFLPSPSNFLSPYTTSPTPSLDLFNNFLDF